MPDWKLIAAGLELEIPETELDRISPPLEGLHSRLRSLLPSVPLLVEPLVSFRSDPEEEP